MSLKPLICEAAQFGQHMACGRCSQTWAAADDAPGCKPRPDPEINLMSIAIALNMIWREIEGSQQALVNSGLRQTPYMGQLQRTAILRAGERLLEHIMNDEVILQRLKEART